MKKFLTTSLASLFALAALAQNLPLQNIPQTVPAPAQSPFNGPARTSVSSSGSDSRTLELTPEELKSKAKEDSIRLEKEKELATQKAKSEFRKRIVGYSIFNDARFENNLLANVPTPKNYVLGTGDKLTIDIYGYAQATYQAVVTPDGYISLPKAGLISVAGMTIESAKTRIASSLSRFFPGLGTSPGSNSTLNISLNNIRGIKVQVIGEVVAPGSYTATSLTTMLNALYAAGGPNEIGSYRQIQLIRRGEVVNTLDLYELILNGYAKSDFVLQDQDVIQVPPYVSRIAVEGLTKRVGLFELLPNESLSDLIKFAGGFNQFAYTHRVKVYRVTPREFKINTVPSDQFAMFQMANGDSLVVDRVINRFENLVTINGAVFRPGEYSLDDSPTLLKLIESAEGLREDAFYGRVSVIRTEDNLRTSNLSVNLADLQTGKVPDVPLKRLDEVFVPSVFDMSENSSIRVYGAINNADATAGVILPFVKDQTIEDVLVKVGGLTEAASLSRIELVRRKRNVDPTQAGAQISDIFYFDINQDLSVSREAQKFKLLPFDEIFVRSSPNYSRQLFVNIEGEVLYPDKYAIQKKDEKISDLILRAGGMTPLAYIDGATLLRKVQLSEAEIEMRRKTISDLTISAQSTQPIQAEELSPEKQEAIGINLRKILAEPGSQEDMILQEGDVIRIPKRLETVRIQGEVLFPTSVKYNGSNLRAYISKSGGFTKKSLRSKAFVLYANGSVDRTRRFLFVHVYPRIEPGSEIIIPQKIMNTQQQLNQFQNILTTLGATLTSITTIFLLTRSLNPSSSN